MSSLARDLMCPTCRRFGARKDCRDCEDRAADYAEERRQLAIEAMEDREDTEMDAWRCF